VVLKVLAKPVNESLPVMCESYEGFVFSVFYFMFGYMAFLMYF